MQGTCNCKYNIIHLAYKYKRRISPLTEFVGWENSIPYSMLTKIFQATKAVTFIMIRGLRFVQRMRKTGYTGTVH